MSPKPGVTATILPANSVSQSVTDTGKATVAAGSLFSSNVQKEVPVSSIVATTEMTEGSKFVQSAQQTDNNCGVIPLSSSSLSSTSQPPPLLQMGGLDIADLAKAGGQNASQSVPSGRVSPAPTLTSGTHGIIRSPGPAGPNAFMSVEHTLVPPSTNQATCKGTQTSSSINALQNSLNSVQPPVTNNRPTVLTALLKSGTPTLTTMNNNSLTRQQQLSLANGASSVAAQSSTTAQQQAIVTHLLHSLVNQSPIPTPATFKNQVPPPPLPTVANSKPDSVVMANCIPVASKMPPQHIQHASMPIPRAASLANGFNPSAFLANPAQLTPQQVMTTAGAILSPNTLLPNVPYLNPFPTIYSSSLVQAPPSTCGIMDPTTAAKNFQISSTGGPAALTLPTSLPVSRDTDTNKPSPPKKPRLG